MRFTRQLAMAVVMAVFAPVLSGCLGIPAQQGNNQGGTTIQQPLITRTLTQPATKAGGTMPVTSDGSVADGSANQFRSEGLSIPDLVEMNAPAVVTVAVRKISNGGLLGGQYQEGVGTGFFIDGSGLIATNNHVVSGANSVTIILYDGTQVPGQVVWTDANSDLGIVKVDETYVKGVVTIGNSDNIRVGEEVVAIGNPMSVEFAGTVTSGIVSAINRKIEVGGRVFNYIQTDAAINGGKSGGPLFNTRGEVIGINAAKIAEMSIEGISFAIPINVLISLIGTNPTTSATANAPVSIGISVKDIPEDLRLQYNVPSGIMVMEVIPGTAAEEAGILAGDILTSFAGEPVTTTVQLNTIKSKYKPGDKVNFTLYRDSDKANYEGEMILRAASGS